MGPKPLTEVLWDTAAANSRSTNKTVRIPQQPYGKVIMGWGGG